jgi:hypothetical protein
MAAVSGARPAPTNLSDRLAALRERQGLPPASGATGTGRFLPGSSD